jgi:glycosyltransferase involved in cell wall biosynthesis
MASPILFVNHAPALGGAEHSLLMLLAHLDRRHWRPHLACAGGPLAERAAALGVSVHTMPLPRLRRSVRAPLDLWCGIRTLMRTARDIRAALLVTNTVRAAFYTAPAARLAGIPFVWHRQDFWLGESRPRYPWVDSAVKSLLCAAAARLVASSAATARRHPCGRKITVVPNGVEVRRLDPATDGIPFRRAHGIADEVLIVGTLGRLCPLKGQERFLRVLARVQAAVPGVWGVVVGGALFGEHDYATNLYRLARELKVAQRAVFTGQIDDPAPALAAMDVFVQPGDPEAFGLVNVEAMAMGKPVVAFRHGALPEIVVDGQSGILVEPGPHGEAAMATAVVRLLQDRDLRARLGRAGRERAVDRFAIERFVAQLSAVFHEVAG